MILSRRSRRLTALRAALYIALMGAACFGQEASEPSVAPAHTPTDSRDVHVQQGDASVHEGEPDKRIFGVLPNYRTAESSARFVPLTVKQKFTIATKDSFDYPVLITTAFFAGLSQMSGSDNNVYGQGVKGFGHRYLISYTDQVTGNYFPEAIVPSIFHLDPRYFRKGEGTIKSRAWYALSRIFVCRTDSGKLAFNANEFVGNSLAAMMASTYHPHERTPGDMISQASTFIETDMAGQLLKEFWPDIKHKLFHKPVHD